MSEILVVTCPSGKQCNHLLPHLYEKGKFKLRLAAHSEASVAKLKTAYPNAEVQACDISSRDNCRALLQGATAVYHVGPSFHSAEKEMGINMIDAAVFESQRPGNVFKHFVFSSVLGTQHRQLMQHDLKSYVEERLFLSPLQWTVLQPTNFMNAYPVQQLAKAERPEYTHKISPIPRNSVVSLDDLAEVAAKVLNEREAHFYAQYPLCSTLPISEGEVLKIIEKQIGKKIKTTTPTMEEGTQALLNFLYLGHSKDDFTLIKGKEGVISTAEGDPRPDIVRDEAQRLLMFYQHRGLTGSPNVMRWLLGREPTSVEDYVKREIEKAG
ncbi:putative nucleoside-diphosphate-sugar epimerase [Xylariaceae sp. FL1272]|nr:putative nucleoside-diphosphate-sugar epimerase [Xylariaceae sp. FL1272]